MMRKVAIYCRVSTRDQHPENQRLELVAYAQRMGLDFEVFEEAESTRNARPVKAALFGRLRKKEYDGVLVWRLDRWARSLSEMILEVQELIDKEIPFISLKDSIDLSTSSGRLMFHLLSALAEFERGVIRERTMLGLERARSQGKTLGRPRGRKDRKPRSKSGYYLRYANRKKSERV
jgi:DNA invertase Pin-like site-specific DNA recombinase